MYIVCIMYILCIIYITATLDGCVQVVDTSTLGILCEFNKTKVCHSNSNQNEEEEEEEEGDNDDDDEDDSNALIRHMNISHNGESYVYANRDSNIFVFMNF